MVGKTLCTYKDNDKIEGGIGIMSTFKIETKTDVETALGLNGERRIISTLKAKIYI